MQCPESRVFTPKNAMRCNCGYDFEAYEIKRPYTGNCPGRNHIVWLRCRRASRWAIGGLILAALAVAGEYYRFSLGPHDQLSGYARLLELLALLVFFCVFLVAIPRGMLASLSQLYKAWRMGLLHRYIWLVVTLPTLLGIGAALLSGGLWSLLSAVHEASEQTGLMQLTEQMKPVVAALHQYEQAQGGRPPTLDTLIAETGQAVSTTTLRACNPLQYRVFEEPYAGARWELLVDCPTGIFKLNSLSYLPSRQCPTNRRYRQMGEWVYHVGS